MFRDLLATISVLMLALVTSLSGCADRLADRASQAEKVPAPAGTEVAPAPVASAGPASDWRPPPGIYRTAQDHGGRVLQGHYAMMAVRAASTAYYLKYQAYPGQATDITETSWLLFAPLNADGAKLPLVHLQTGEEEPPAHTWGLHVGAEWQTIRLGASPQHPKSHSVATRLAPPALRTDSVPSLDALRYSNFRSTLMGMIVDYSRVHGVLPDRWETVRDFMQFAPVEGLAEQAAHVAVLGLALDRPTATWWLTLHWPGSQRLAFTSVACTFDKASGTVDSEWLRQTSLPASLEPFGTFRFPLMEEPHSAVVLDRAPPKTRQHGGKISGN